MSNLANKKVQVQSFDKNSRDFALLESVCSSWKDDFWSFASVCEAIALKSNKTFYISNAKEIEGIILADVGGYSAELLYVYVRKEYRGQKISSLLLDKLIEDLTGLDEFENLFLEVRTENSAAIKLYESHGFLKVGERKNYYSNNEDALVYSYEFKSKNQ